MSGAQDEFSTARPKVLRREDLDGFRISPDDTNYMIPLADALRNADDGVNFTAIIEVFAVGGKTPPNTHHIAAELFYVLDGHARARANGEQHDLGPGDSLLVPPGIEHVVENAGSTKLYTLTVMSPNEGFAELIHGGEPIEPGEDLEALGGGAT